MLSFGVNALMVGINSHGSDKSGGYNNPTFILLIPEFVSPMRIAGDKKLV